MRHLFNKQCLFFLLLMLVPFLLNAQLNWRNADSVYSITSNTVHVFYTNDSIDGKPNKAFYIVADLKDKHLNFTVDTTVGRRLTPKQYFERNNSPIAVVNCTFFEFVHNSNLNLVMKDGKIFSFNNQSVAGKGKDTFTYKHVLSSAIGIDKKRNADVAWTYTDSSFKKVFASQIPFLPKQDSVQKGSLEFYQRITALSKWNMQTAVGGGPVLLQNGEIKITNNEELKFAGKAINDKHPRTAIGYTKDGKLIILVIEGRFPGKAEGATLLQEAKILKEIGCWEALNLDGGGSSCLLVNGKETITPSDKEGERPVPAVFMIQLKNKN